MVMMSERDCLSKFVKCSEAEAIHNKRFGYGPGEVGIARFGTRSGNDGRMKQVNCCH